MLIVPCWSTLVINVVFTVNHLISYPCPKGISSYWGVGFIAGSVVSIQLVTGVLLGLHYSPGVPVAYYSIIHLEREVYYGGLVRGIHSQVASPVFLAVYPHTLRALPYGSYLYSSSVTWTGILGLLLLMATAFMGYILPWGQMSY